MGAKATDAEDAIAIGEVPDRRPDRCDLTSQLAAEDPPLRPAQTDEEADEEGMGAAPAAVGAVDSGRVDLDEDLIVFGDGLLDLLEALHLRRAIAVVDHRSHGQTSFLRLAAHGHLLLDAPAL